MPNVLVISDDQDISRDIEACFQQKKWTPVTMGMNVLIANGSTHAENYGCMVIVIDSGFRKRFGGLIAELMPLVRNCSAKLHLYLVLESESPPELNLWIPHIAQTFMLDGERARLHEAVNKIMHREWQPVPITAFVSPMQGE